MAKLILYRGLNRPVVGRETRESVVNTVTYVFLAIVAVVILIQLYNVLGRKVGFRPEDKPVIAKGDDFELSVKTAQIETSRTPNLDMLKTRDANFNELNFLEKARETYEQIVVAFHKGEIETVKDKLSEAVYKIFAGAIAERPVRDEHLSFVDQPKADIDVIDFKDDVAQIRVRFLSELAYESHTTLDPPAETEASAVPVTTKAAKPQKTYKRTAEFWTFQKGMRLANSPWLLTKVEVAKA
ncbi:MAG: Tim44/TimA family putative adaptor protein [Asticcacaulis sp.]|nr:Tim44/TimA family putative adaptor protein [Asticcacaulis sp.]